jgi:drug/metabolite transporter (DMT)-like permease
MSTEPSSLDPRDRRPRRRGLVGPALLVIAVVHLLVTPLFYGDSVASIIDAGVLGAVDADPSLVDLRSASFWYVIAGIGMAFVGADVTWIERRWGRPPPHVGWLLLVLGCVGVVLMPVSPFWLFFVVAAMVAHSHRTRREDGSVRT